MITAKIDFPCKICNNRQRWYVMPLKEKVKSGSFINSFTSYDLSCKKCGKHYILKFSIKAV